MSRSTAYECVHTGELPVLRLGRRIIVTRATLLRLLGLDPLASNPSTDQRQRPRQTTWHRQRPTGGHSATKAT